MVAKTYKQLWESNSELTIQRRVYIDKLNTDGTYEGVWTQLDEIFTRRKPISGLSRKLSNSSWKFGAVSVGSCAFDILNPYGGFSSEEDPTSIFNGFVRDRSKIKLVDKVRDQSIDDQSDPEAWSQEINVFEGLIDADRTSREDVMEKVTALDYTSVFKDINIKDIVEGDTVQNGTFDTDSKWALGAGWTIEGGKANAGTGNMTQTQNLAKLLEYTIYYKVSSLTTGSIAVQMGSTTDTSRTKNGEYSFKHTAASFAEVLTFIPSGSTDAAIDDVRVVRLTDVADLVYEIVSNPIFAKYFNTSASTTYIDPPISYDIDASVYDGSVFSVLESLSTGMSIFFVDIEDGFFYFKTPSPSASVDHEFNDFNNRKLKIRGVREGTDRVFNAVYWSGQDEEAIDSTVIRIKEITINISGVYDATQRQNIIDYILDLQKTKKRYFFMDFPYAPFLNLLNRVSVETFGQVPDNATRWGFVEWQDIVWSKAVGIKIEKSLNWKIRGVDHDGSLKTTVELELI